jgi:hypothetical protein
MNRFSTPGCSSASCGGAAGLAFWYSERAPRLGNSHHVFTYCNAVHQVLKRIGNDRENVADFNEASRAIL